MVRELKFNLHDSVNRKFSESFGKIKEAIITRINLELDNTIEIADSLKMGTKIVFVKPKLESSLSVDKDIKVQENLMFMEEYKINFTIFRQSELKFKEQWVKAFVLIWDSFCSR